MSGSSLFKFIATAFLSIVLLVCCKQPTTNQESDPASNGVKYATGFTISEVENNKSPENLKQNKICMALMAKVYGINV